MFFKNNKTRAMRASRIHADRKERPRGPLKKAPPGKTIGAPETEDYFSGTATLDAASMTLSQFDEAPKIGPRSF